MIQIRPGNRRGLTATPWLDSRHSFSFNRYYDAGHMGFRSLRVINEDRIAPGGKFGSHPHRDMEILTWVLSGALEHEDSTGARGLLRPGDLQKMTAGTGIYHSEANPSAAEPLHLLQIWILPSEHGLAPGYWEKHFAAGQRCNRLALLASPGARGGSLPLSQDAELWASILEPGHSAVHALARGRHAWLQVASGAVTVNGLAVEAGDGAAVSQETGLEIAARAQSEILLFDLA